MKIGFIGLGSMGAPIARRLARCGFDVTGFVDVGRHRGRRRRPGLRAREVHQRPGR